MGEGYWLWRDRKCLFASPLGVLANALAIYGLATSLWLRMPPMAARLTMATLSLQVLRTLVRMGAVTHIYGFVFSLGVPLRIFYANVLNAAGGTGLVFRLYPEGCNANTALSSDTIFQNTTDTPTTCSPLLP